MSVAAVVFDLDGVLVDSEQVWDAARRELVAEFGLPWPEGATRAMMGMSSHEWTRHVHDELGVTLPLEEINRRIVDHVLAVYHEAVPWLPGARGAVARMAERWPLGLATSSNRPVIEAVLDAGLRVYFAVTVSSEEVGRGKPAPDVYLAATRLLGIGPSAAAAIEDSSNGIRAARAAGMRVIAVPNREFPPDPDALALADAVVEDLHQLTEDVVAPQGSRG